MEEASNGMQLNGLNCMGYKSVPHFGLFLSWVHARSMWFYEAGKNRAVSLLVFVYQVDAQCRVTDALAVAWCMR